MLLLASVLAAGAGVALTSAGYLFGARLGRGARAQLAERNGALEGAVRELEARATATQQGDARATQQGAALEAALRSLSERVSDRAGDEQELREVRAVRDELRELAKAVQVRERAQESFAKELDARLAALASRGEDPAELRKELQRAVSPLLQREHEVRGLQQLLRETLSPLVAREKLGLELARVEAGASLADLPRTLDAIAEKGGFSAVVLGDEAGLPLGASAHTHDAEALAGRASLLHTLAERAARDGVPRPLSVVVQDEAGQRTLHRLFTVDEQRYMLTAVTRAAQLEPDALDPALVKLERVLARHALWS